MKEFNKITKGIGSLVKLGCGIVFYGFMCVGPRVIEEVVVTTKYAIGKVNYNDAVKAIMSSSMLDSGKTEALALLKNDRDNEYYKAIIQVLSSDMLGSKKVESIRELSER